MEAKTFGGTMSCANSKNKRAIESVDEILVTRHFSDGRLGVIVGLVAMSMFTPLFDMTAASGGGP